MDEDQRIRCRVPDDRVAKGIAWLEIHKKDRGYYLYQYEAIDQPCKWDTFSDDMEALLADCERIWGVAQSDWEKIA